MFFYLLRKSSIPFILTLQTMFLIFTVSLQAEERAMPLASDGILDLRDHNFIENPILRLDGEWLIYPGTTAEEIMEDWNPVGAPVTVPSYMSSAVIPQKNRFGFFSFTLKILLPPGDEDFLALAMENITPNYRLVINGKERSSAGVVLPDPKLSRPGNKPFLIPLKGEELDLIVSVSNYHNIAGGINRSLLFGDYNTLSRKINFRMLLDSFALGSLFIISFYSLFIFSVDRKRVSYLYLSLICLIALVFSGLKGQMILVRILPFLGGEIRTKLIYLSLSNIGGAVYFYTTAVNPRMKMFRLRTFYLAFMTLGSALTILTPMAVYTQFVVLYEVLGLGSLSLMLILSIARFPGTIWREARLLILIIFAFCSIMLIGILDDATMIPFSSISLTLLLVILTIIIVQAWEYNRSVARMSRLAESRKELVRVNRELREISHRDSLTGVANRRRFDQHLKNLETTCRNSDKPVGLIMTDIDYFKNFNDYFGHQEGDQCLVKVAEELKSTLHRQSDFIARYGGEEFAIVLQDLDREGVLMVAEKLRKKIEDLSIPHPESRLGNKVVTVSMGCAILDQKSKYTFRELISMADHALYEAKHHGRNRVCFQDVPLTNSAAPGLDALLNPGES